MSLRQMPPHTAGFRDSDIFRLVFERVVEHASQRAWSAAKASQSMPARSWRTPTWLGGGSDRPSATDINARALNLPVQTQTVVLAI